MIFLKLVYKIEIYQFLILKLKKALILKNYNLNNYNLNNFEYLKMDKKK